MVLTTRFWAVDPFLHLPEAPRGLTIGVALALAHDAPNLPRRCQPPAMPQLHAHQAVCWPPRIVDLLRVSHRDLSGHAVGHRGGAETRRDAHAAAPTSHPALALTAMPPLYLHQVMCWALRTAPSPGVRHECLLGTPRIARGGIRARRTPRTSPGPDLPRWWCGCAAAPFRRLRPRPSTRDRSPCAGVAA